jgi:predicted phage terminase large subunit-like protein
MNLHELLALLPRGTLKSSCITIGLSIQFFLNYSEERILIDSETWTKSTNFLVELKGHFEGNEIVRGMFKAAWGVYPNEDKSKAWSDSKIVLSSRKKPRKEPSVDTAGVEVTKNGMHYDLILFDDLHSENNTKTKEQIEKVKEHFKLAYSLLDPGCPVVVIGTRWTFDDLYQLIIDEYGEDFNFITRSAKSPQGNLLYPSRLTEEQLRKFRKKQGAYLFSCQYMNDPVDSETADFKREWFKYKNWRDVEGIPINWYLTIDPSAGGKQADYAAFVLSGMDYQSQVYVRYVLRIKMNYAAIVMKTIDLYRQFPEIKRIAVETLATQTTLEYTYKEKMKELNFWMPIQFINSRQKSKEERILALAPKYEFGMIYHIRDCPQINDLEDELLKFPKAPNDDASDAFATVLEIAHPTMRGASNPQRSTKRKALLKKLNAPRSPMIGY